MSASELFKAGQLQEAIDAQVQAVKAAPGDHAKRLFLFEMLSFAGELDRAKKQIDAIMYGELELDAAVMQYRRNLDSEDKRRQLFKNGTAPKFLQEPPEHVKLRLEAVVLLKDKKPKEAAAVLARPEVQAHAHKGTMNGKAFTEFRDIDDLFGSVLEVFAQGNYFWVPIEQVESVLLNAPKFPRDLLWRPAKLSTRGDAEGDVFIPALYPGSHESPDPQLRLGRATDWKSEGDGPVLGVGARDFLIGEDPMSIYEWRELVFDVEPPAAESASP
jgi:type VI secretion system protein ImpE